jgi:hypothetical protein
MKKVTAIVMFFFMIAAMASTVWSQEMQPAAYEKKVAAFTQRVLDGQTVDFLEAKKELVEDLYRTAYIDDFYAKYDSIIRYSKSLGFEIERRLAATKSADEFKAVKDRYAQWNDLCTMADRAPEDFQKGVIQEYLLDKSRKGQPPFEISNSAWEPDEETSPDIEALKKELPKAEAALQSALGALKSRNEEDFANLFPEKLQLLRKAEPEYSEINKLFKTELENHWKDGMTSDVAPLFIRADLDEAARLYKNDKVVKTVVRRWQGQEARVSAVYMEKEDGKNYIIKNWEQGTFDMRNRRR